MANEISITTGLSCTNGTFKVLAQTVNKKYDQTTARGGQPGVLSIGSLSEETVTFTDITPGWCMITNLDSTNFVDFGFSTGVYGLTLPPEASIVVKFKAGMTLYALADTADCDVQITALSD